jgi:hypothetical protein
MPKQEGRFIIHDGGCVDRRCIIDVGRDRLGEAKPGKVVERKAEVKKEKPESYVGLRRGLQALAGPPGTSAWHCVPHLRFRHAASVAYYELSATTGGSVASDLAVEILSSQRVVSVLDKWLLTVVRKGGVTRLQSSERYTRVFENGEVKTKMSERRPRGRAVVALAVA